MNKDMHEDFLGRVWGRTVSVAMSDLATEYVRVLVAQMKREIEDALPVQGGRWKSVKEITVGTAFGAKISLQACQDEMIGIMSANREKVKAVCEHENKSATQESVRYWRARFWANEFSYVINRNRPTVQKIMELMNKER